MTTAELLSHLRKLNVKLWADNGQLICNGPKGVLTSALRAELIERKADILTYLRNAASSGRFRNSPLQHVSRDGNLPLSFAQERLWFLDQLEPSSPVYNVPSGMRLRGPLNITALERSLNEIVRRHEALRTTFSMVEGQPVQTISPSLNLLLPIMDLGHLPAGERDAEIRRLGAKEARRPFDLARGPLLRVTLLRLDDEDHVLLLTMHHIVSDGWSIGVLHRELSILYEAFSNGKPNPLPPLFIQYADFAVWQRNWLQEEVLKPQLSYWKSQLYGMPVLQLPTDRPRPAVQSHRGAKQSFVFSTPLFDQLKSLSRKEEVTLFMTLLAAFQILIHRYTRQEDIAVGSPVAGRNQPEIENLIGFFVNTLLLRTDLSDNPTFRDLLARVRGVALGAYDHQDVPFEKLVEELQPERTLSRSPLFQVMFAFHNAPSSALKLEGLTLSPLNIDSETAKFDLLLSMQDGAERLRGLIEYNTDLFDASTIARLLRHFEVLLKGIVANPDRRISDLPLLTEAERHQLLVEWNDTKKDYADDKCIHQLFEEQVEKSPNAVAVVFEGQQLTYGELNARANQVAHYLKKLGVGPEVRVGNCVERSLEMVVALLGILKAGGVYLPLDPSYPKERLAFMMEDAQTPVVLIQKQFASRLLMPRAQRVFLDTSWGVIAQETAENPIGKANPKNPVYLLYTSGSTGIPKGVVMEHRALSNLISWQVQNFRCPIEARTLQFAPQSFDVSFQEIFSTWCSGGTLVLVSEEVRRDPSLLLQFLTAEEIERVFLPFIALQQLAEAAEGKTSLPTSLREIITAGEQLRMSRPIAGLVERLKDCQLYNQYGPTETHVVTSFTVTGSATDWPTLPPIGRPI